MSFRSSSLRKSVNVSTFLPYLSAISLALFASTRSSTSHSATMLRCDASICPLPWPLKPITATRMSAVF